MAIHIEIHLEEARLGHMDQLVGGEPQAPRPLTQGGSMDELTRLRQLEHGIGNCIKIYIAKLKEVRYRLLFLHNEEQTINRQRQAILKGK